MAVSRRVLARHIARQLAGGDGRRTVLTQLAAYLVVHKRLDELELLVADISRNLAKLGTVKATVTVAHPLDAELKRAVEQYVKRIENATTVQIEESIDPAVLGGIIVETPHKRFDAAVSTQLTRLRNV
jgi:F0F1-type ATP synthase delta subunit